MAYVDTSGFAWTLGPDLGGSQDATPCFALDRSDLTRNRPPRIVLDLARRRGIQRALFNVERAAARPWAGDSALPRHTQCAFSRDEYHAGVLSVHGCFRVRVSPRPDSARRPAHAI